MRTRRISTRGAVFCAACCWRSRPAVGGALIAKAGATTVTTAPVFLGGFLAGGLVWTLFLCGLASHGRKRAGTGLLRVCHVLSALLFAYFSYSVIVNGYRDLIVQTARAAG